MGHSSSGSLVGRLMWPSSIPPGIYHAGVNDNSSADNPLTDNLLTQQSFDGQIKSAKAKSNAKVASMNCRVDELSRRRIVG